MQQEHALIEVEQQLEAIENINMLYKLLPKSEEEWSEILLQLEFYQPGISDILTQSKILMDPNEALMTARERDKPILL